MLIHSLFLTQLLCQVKFICLPLTRSLSVKSEVFLPPPPPACQPPSQTSQPANETSSRNLLIAAQRPDKGEQQSQDLPAQARQGDRILQAYHRKTRLTFSASSNLALRDKIPENIQAEGLLSLPCPNTLRRLLSSSDCMFGFNELSFENIKKALDGKKPFEWWGCLLFDEKSISAYLTFDAKLLECQDIVNYGDSIKEAFEKVSPTMHWCLCSGHTRETGSNHSPASLLKELIKFAGGKANYDFYSRLYNHERLNGLRLTHRLTESHIYPTNFQRMNVGKAAQVLSRTVAMAMKHYRDQRRKKE
ncbi:Uncharacterized protein APZ42_023184 [Daphnia magna]|uniref:Transposable element P transposase-like GTP-binding insertion domain-containing protein n=1 Tax=Daphnia magna TaxID=35525 RepID=A0A162DHY6_9CRUS|nr:Uncharacterized protein APZ42_023184 [Daphnia magna]